MVTSASIRCPIRLHVTPHSTQFKCLTVFFRRHAFRASVLLPVVYFYSQADAGKKKKKSLLSCAMMQTFSPNKPSSRCLHLYQKIKKIKKHPLVLLQYWFQVFPPQRSVFLGPLSPCRCSSDGRFSGNASPYIELITQSARCLKVTGRTVGAARAVRVPLQRDTETHKLFLRGGYLFSYYLAWVVYGCR